MRKATSQSLLLLPLRRKLLPVQPVPPPSPVVMKCCRTSLALTTVAASRLCCVASAYTDHSSSAIMSRRSSFCSLSRTSSFLRTSYRRFCASPVQRADGLDHRQRNHSKHHDPLWGCLESFAIQRGNVDDVATEAAAPPRIIQTLLKGGSISLPELARELPDEILEELQDGLKAHILRCTRSYTLNRRVGSSALYVSLTSRALQLIQQLHANNKKTSQNREPSAKNVERQNGAYRKETEQNGLSAPFPLSSFFQPVLPAAEETVARSFIPSRMVPLHALVGQHWLPHASALRECIAAWGDPCALQAMSFSNSSRSSGSVKEEQSDGGGDACPASPEKFYDLMSTIHTRSKFHPFELISIVICKRTNQNKERGTENAESESGAVISEFSPLAGELLGNIQSCSSSSSSNDEEDDTVEAVSWRRANLQHDKSAIMDALSRGVEAYACQNTAQGQENDCLLESGRKRKEREEELLYIHLCPYLSGDAAANGDAPCGFPADSACEEEFVQEYDVYRLFRTLSCTEFTPLQTVHTHGRDLTTKPPLQVLLVDHIERVLMDLWKSIRNNDDNQQSSEDGYVRAYHDTDVIDFDMRKTADILRKDSELEERWEKLRESCPPPPAVSSSSSPASAETASKSKDANSSDSLTQDSTSSSSSGQVPALLLRLSKGATLSGDTQTVQESSLLSLLHYERRSDESLQVVAARFNLHRESLLDASYFQAPTHELKMCLDEVNRLKRAMKTMKNRNRVVCMRGSRNASVCLSLRGLEYKPPQCDANGIEIAPSEVVPLPLDESTPASFISPMCHPHVLAYYLFDLLPLSGAPILTGHLPELLPIHIRRITNARSRSWLKTYPHLFKFVDCPPNIACIRADVAASIGIPVESSAVISDEQFALRMIQQSLKDAEGEDGASIEVDACIDAMQRNERIEKALLDLVEARSKKKALVLTSMLGMHLSTDVRKAIRARGGIDLFMRARPHLFTLTPHPLHSNTFIVALTPSAPPSPSSPHEAADSSLPQ